MVAATVATIPREYIETFTLIDSRHRKIFSNVILPATSPQVYDHLRISAAWAWSYLLVAEIVAAKDGIGYIILQSQRFLQTDKMFAAVLLIATLGAFTDLFFLISRHWLFPWYEWRHELQKS